MLHYRERSSSLQPFCTTAVVSFFGSSESGIFLGCRSGAYLLQITILWIHRESYGFWTMVIYFRFLNGKPVLSIARLQSMLEVGVNFV